MLRKIFGPKWGEVTGDCRRLHEELHDLHCSPNIIRVIKYGTMRCAECGTFGREGRSIQKFGGETFRRETDHLEDPVVDT
jgi:hypothetical protein